MAKMDMPLRYNWGGGTPTPTKTPTPTGKVLYNSGKSKYKPKNSGNWSYGQASELGDKYRNVNNSGNGIAKVVGTPINKSQERAYQSIKKMIAEGSVNPSSNALLGGENKVAMRSPYSSFIVTYTGNPYSPYSITPNNASLNQAAIPMSYQNIGKGTGLDAQQNQALTYNGMGDLQLLNYYQSLLNETAMSNNKTYGEYSPIYYGGYGYGGGGYSRGSYSPFDFFFNLLNWRI